MGYSYIMGGRQDLALTGCLGLVTMGGGQGVVRVGKGGAGAATVLVPREGFLSHQPWGGEDIKLVLFLYRCRSTYHQTDWFNHPVYAINLPFMYYRNRSERKRGAISLLNRNSSSQKLEFRLREIFQLGGNTMNFPVLLQRTLYTYLLFCREHYVLSYCFVENTIY